MKSEELNKKFKNTTIKSDKHTWSPGGPGGPRVPYIKKTKKVNRLEKIYITLHNRPHLRHLENRSRECNSLHVIL